PGVAVGEAVRHALLEELDPAAGRVGVQAVRRGIRRRAVALDAPRVEVGVRDAEAHLPAGARGRGAGAAAVRGRRPQHALREPGEVVVVVYGVPLHLTRELLAEPACGPVDPLRRRLVLEHPRGAGEPQVQRSLADVRHDLVEPQAQLRAELLLFAREAVLSGW